MNPRDFNKLIASIKEAGQIKKGKTAPSRTFEFSEFDIKSLRKRFAVSQSAFATMLGVSTRTLQNWEQGRRHPMGPARALLKVATQHPKAVLDALNHYT